jgi:TatD DNase family protein
MRLIDTHAHLYLEQFDADISAVISAAKVAGVERILLPAIDSQSFTQQARLTNSDPVFFRSMLGLHPTSVKENWRSELEFVDEKISEANYVAIGEAGIDLYWDKSFFEEQKKVFRYQLELSLKLNLPIAIHCRDSFDETVSVISEFQGEKLKGVFHAFSGNYSQAEWAVSNGFLIGVGGVVTFKNAGLAEVVKNIDLKYILLETDAPFLAPVPYRGKRNEPAWLRIVAEKIALIKGIGADEVAERSSLNAYSLFQC